MENALEEDQSHEQGSEDSVGAGKRAQKLTRPIMVAGPASARLLDLVQEKHTLGERQPLRPCLERMRHDPGLDSEDSWDALGNECLVDPVLGESS